MSVIARPEICAVTAANAANMADTTSDSAFRRLSGLNVEQTAAVTHGKPADRAGLVAGTVSFRSGPLLVIAGAGTGKTATLAHRVVWLLQHGVAPDRIALLTFSRRAAAEMVTRVSEILYGQGASENPICLPYAGTFHSVGARLLRDNSREIGLDPAFSIIDRADSIDLIDWLRNDLGLAEHNKRFARASTCLAIYSDRVNTGEPLKEVLHERFPWCQDDEEEIRSLLSAYVDRKLSDALLDYDDLLLWWHMGMQNDNFASRVRTQFDHMLVDEFQDSNQLQMQILKALKPEGDGLFAVGDDAQSIYSFRAARIELFHQFHKQFNPPAGIVTLKLITGPRSPFWIQPMH